MSVSLSEERDRIQRQVEELEQGLSLTHAELELLSSETDDESGCEDKDEERQSATGLLAQREKIQKEIQNLENVLGPHSPISVSDDDSSGSSDESDLGLSLSVDSCLQMNLVYQQVVEENLVQLETLLAHNRRHQKELVSQLSGPIKEPPRLQTAPSSYQQPINMYLGRFLKPYFKDKLTGLGPPANQETKEKTSRITGCLDDKKLKIKRWEGWQKTLLIHSVARDSLRRLIQPKLSKVDYLSQKLSLAEEKDRQQLREQIDSLEREIDLLRGKKEDELIGDRFEEHDWQKISNIDFEGTKDAEDIRCFWQNFLHPSINKTRWSQEEVQQLKEVSGAHGERHWKTIAQELGTGRTAFMCLQTFQRFVSDSLRRGSWTPAEDTQLRELVDKMRIGNFIPYTQMSYFMEGRDPAQLIYRWNQVLDPSLKKGPWTKQEDELLLRAVSRYGEKNWWKIRSEVPGRTDCACRDRYNDCLKAGTKRGAFDEQERALLLQLVEKHGIGRWAKIAAEIPHRYDAQCLREWRKLSKPQTAVAQKDEKTEKNKKNQDREKKKKRKDFSVKKNIRRKLRKLKEEEVSSEEEQEEMVVEYIDSDEEKKQKKKEAVEVERTEEEVLEEEEQEEEEEPYTIPPMQEWIPVEKAQHCSFLTFRPVALPSSADAHSGEPVRSTILGKFGRSVMIGPHPRELQWEEQHSSSTMMMVSPDQLRAHLYRQAQNFNNQSSCPEGKLSTSKQNHRVTDMGLNYELQAAVTPWIGNLLIPVKTRLTAADALREQGEKTQLSSTPVFLLLLQTMNVDTVGCKEMIEQRKNRVTSLTPPPDPSSVWKKNPKTVAGILEQRKAMKEELQKLDLQHKLILKQLQALQGQDKRQQLQRKQKVRPQQLILLQQPQPRPPHFPPSLPPKNHPGILQMPPNGHPQMPPKSFPQAVFITHPVLKPQKNHSASIQHIPPSSLDISPPSPCRQPPGGVVTSSLHTPSHRLDVPPVSMVPMIQNATTTSSVSIGQQAVPQTQSLSVAQAPSLNQAVSIGSALVNQQSVPSTLTTPTPFPSQPCPSPSPPCSTMNLPTGRGQKETNNQDAVCSSQKEEDFGGADNGVKGACAGVEGAVDSVIEEGRRIRTPSQKARALQEVTKAKAKAKKKATSSPRMKAPTQNTNSPEQPCVLLRPQQLCPASIQLEPQTLASSLTTPPKAPQRPAPGPVNVSSSSKTEAPSLEPPPAVGRTHSPTLTLNVTSVSVDLPQTSTPSSSDRDELATQNLSLVPPTSSLANQHTASSTTGLTASSQSHHDYSVLTPYPGPSQPSPAPKQPNPMHYKSDSTQNATQEGQPRGRKRGRGEEQDRGTSSQDDHCVVQEGKRVRKPSQKARALQEATEAKEEAKKKTTTSSHKKRSRTSRTKEGVIIQGTAQLPRLRLLAGQSMWVITPGGLAKLVEAPPQGLQLALVPSVFPPPSPGNILNRPLPTPPLQFTSGSCQQLTPKPPTMSIPANPSGLNQTGLLPDPPTCASQPLPPTLVLQPVQNPGSSPLPSGPPQYPTKFYLPYKGTIRVDPAEPPPLRKEALQFDPSLMFLEPRAAVCDWLSGQGGVVVPGLGVALPYLPPFVSSLSTLSALLRAKKSLIKSSLQLLGQGSDPGQPQTPPRPGNSTDKTPSQPPTDQPDSTSDLTPAGDQPAPSVGSDLLQGEEEEAELVAAVRQLVTERFSSNPAYQLLKARFLSCFTVPALLATIQPVTEKTGAPLSTQEEEDEEEGEDEEEEELKKIKERGRQRRAERSLPLCEGSGALASHFSGIINTGTPTKDQARPDQ